MTSAQVCRNVVPTLHIHLKYNFEMTYEEPFELKDHHTQMRNAPLDKLKLHFMNGIAHPALVGLSQPEISKPHCQVSTTLFITT